MARIGWVMKAVVASLWLAHSCSGQFTSQTYPDPRNDPLNCKVAAPGPICDPAEIIPPNERNALADRIKQLVSVTTRVRNTSPACDAFPGRPLEVIVAVLDKIGTAPLPTTEIEKFANSLRSRYLNFQDAALCDMTVLVVNSKTDRQVYTVAGRDARLTKDVLRKVFDQNIATFKAHRYAAALQGMVELLVTAYGNAHQTNLALPAAFRETSTDAVIPSIVNGVEQQKPSEEFSVDTSEVNTNGPRIEELKATDATDADKSDQLWLEIMQKAIARCGRNEHKLSRYVQAVVEEAMDISLRLLSDARYNAIEQNAQSFGGDSEGRSRAWATAKTEFIDAFYQQRSASIMKGAQRRCPATVTALRFATKH